MNILKYQQFKLAMMKGVKFYKINYSILGSKEFLDQTHVSVAYLNYLTLMEHINKRHFERDI